MSTLQKAFEVTAAFEGGGYTALSGNFDGQGISFGFLQWNLGQGTLQPLIRTFFDNGPATFRKCFTQFVASLDREIDLSEEILRVCSFPKTYRNGVLGYWQAIDWCRERQDSGGRFLPHYSHWVKAFQALGKVTYYQTLQRRAAKRYMDLALSYMRSYGFKSERALCLMFDITVQMGSIGVGARTRYAAATWGKVMSEEKKLEAMARAIAHQGGRWASDVLSRKLTIALGKGIVHGRAYNLATDFGVTMAPAVLTDTI